MKRYIVVLASTATHTTEIEAETPGEAGTIALEQGVSSLCHQEEVELSDDWDIEYIEEVED